MWFPKRPVRSGSRAGPSDVFAAHSALDQPGVFALHGPFYRRSFSNRAGFVAVYRTVC
jgi:hypothetical protein